MYEEILTASTGHPAYEAGSLPEPIQETLSIVRLPASQDDQTMWQGATIIKDSESRYIIRFDDGRVSMHSTPAAAWTFYAENADCWM